MKNQFHVGVVLMCAAVLAGCASSNSGGVYSREQTRQAQTVKMGVVESVRSVKIEGTRSGIGAATGAVVGGVAGSELGGGKGKVLTTVVGAVAGGLAGAAVEEGVTRKDGLEITVRLDNGALLAVVQEADEAFHPGERVRILESGGVTRVSH
ncbi:MAG: glycine zipper 2TM domain-containing protein [Methylophilaceae bacterium]|nr:glycine zipper 2TM domain-containing protein [Methylophilaceae bacterium]